MLQGRRGEQGASLPEDHLELEEGALRVLVLEVQRRAVGRGHTQALYERLHRPVQLAVPVDVRKVHADGLLGAGVGHLQHPRGCAHRTGGIISDEERWCSCTTLHL